MSTQIHEPWHYFYWVVLLTFYRVKQCHACKCKDSRWNKDLFVRSIVVWWGIICVNNVYLIIVIYISRYSENGRDVNYTTLNLLWLLKVIISWWYIVPELPYLILRLNSVSSDLTHSTVNYSAELLPFHSYFWLHYSSAVIRPSRVTLREFIIEWRTLFQKHS